MTGTLLWFALACAGGKEPPATPTTTAGQGATPAPPPPGAGGQARPPGAGNPPPPPNRDIAINTRSLCQSGETVHFSCPLAEARVASLCGDADPGAAGAALQLRVGRPGNLDVRFPTGAPDSAAAFTGQGTEVRVTTGRMGYAVFSDADGGGVATFAPSGARTDARCLATPAGDLAAVVAALGGQQP